MNSLIKIRNVLHGTDTPLTADEQSVVTMICHLTALQIAAMPDKASRSAAVAELPANLAEAIKAEIVQAFELRRTAS